MTNVEIDDEVFAYLQAHAKPWVDTPNDVLRRLLLGKEGKSPLTTSTGSSTMSATLIKQADPGAFVRTVLTAEFGSELRRRPPYQFMFESESVLVYCQNFSKEAKHLWYRITANPWRDLRTARKPAWVCLTNPVERFAYLIPVAEIKQRVEKRGWRRDYLEVNIDPATSRWTELDWDLTKYRRKS